jgi:hypothetical protein
MATAGGLVGANLPVEALVPLRHAGDTEDRRGILCRAARTACTRGSSRSTTVAPLR